MAFKKKLPAETNPVEAGEITVNMDTPDESAPADVKDTEVQSKDVVPPTPETDAKKAVDSVIPSVKSGEVITFNPDPVGSKAQEQKKVKVSTVRDHSCTIGGQSYAFKKGKVVVVPENVKRVLKKAGILAPL